ncbi:BBE domain-containing protein [Desulforamulus aquiferis]|uniref:BBE domain-containing protein n=1 Tax=Desulforamulus aquiferis TaxID=1397668 RepID=A0AAW7ZCY0_9FIRM|nr:BBE domain-containing protein [Desulforamulus aquiferis]MDO7787549.1 BBE domain-containing protein [Desulforamulus aquiferis]
MQDKFDFLKGITTGSYINFPFSPLKNYEEAYFGKNANILNYIKAIYDPLNVFNFPQSIN